MLTCVSRARSAARVGSWGFGRRAASIAVALLAVVLAVRPALAQPAGDSEADGRSAPEGDGGVDGGRDLDEASDAASAEAGDEASAEIAPATLRYTLEGIEIRGNERTAERVILRFVPFSVGDVLDVADDELELTRYRLLGTGFFSAVRLSLRKGSKRGAAVLVIHVTERNTLILEKLSMGVAADEDSAGNAEPLSPFLGVEAAETNLAGSGITIGAGLGLAADQWTLGARFADPAFLGTGWTLSANVLYADARDFFGNRQVSFESPDLLDQRSVTDYAVVSYRRFGGALGAGHDLSLATRLSFDYRLERIAAIVPTIASHLRGTTREPIDFDIVPGTSVLSELRAAIVYDTRDTPFLPRRGMVAALRIGAGLSPLGSTYDFFKAQGELRAWWSLPWSHVVSFHAELDAIVGDPPFFEKFYVGDYTDLLPDRILGLNPDRRQPPNYLGTDIAEVRYGDYAAKVEGEYRIPLYSGTGSVYGVDFFAAAGLYAVATHRELVDPPAGYEGASLVPVDLTYNLGFRVETYVGGFSLAFSNLLGLLPGRGGDRK